jgi:hypothetical protein
MLVRILNLFIRPSIGRSQALAMLQQAAVSKGWDIEPPDQMCRELWFYSGVTFLRGSNIPVSFFVHGRSGEVAHLERCDQAEDSLE